MQMYDFIIAGGGAAGLSLACEMIHSPLRDRSILIVDKDAKDRNDRTWCFWADRPTRFDAIVSRSWSRLRFASSTYTKIVDLYPYRYQMIRRTGYHRADRGWRRLGDGHHRRADLRGALGLR